MAKAIFLVSVNTTNGHGLCLHTPAVKVEWKIMSYVDYSEEVEETTISNPYHREEPTFPERLHYALENAEKDGYEDAISWQLHGRSFLVHDPEKLTEKVLKL